MLKGTEKLREKLPDYPGKRLLFIPLLFFITFIFGLFFLLFSYTITNLFPNNQFLLALKPVLPIFCQTSLVGIGFFLISRVWARRSHLIDQTFELAFQRGFIWGIVGIPLVLAVVMHNFFLVIIPNQPLNTLSGYLFNSIITILDLPQLISLIVQSTGIVFLLLGILTGYRALTTFGVDYMALIYLYYPEESELQDHKIYSVLRHPAYFGLVLVAVGGLFFRLSGYALYTLILFLIGINLHLILVEEKELIERFGDSYRQYKKRVPALMLGSRQVISFLQFILGRE
ncbi:MAG: methyltransferase family protein [Candidatus Heimdallarchaeota archaeon]